jgi:DNA-binding transcriptional LysR family regulator
LRAYFDDPLFIRQGNRVVPTERTRSVIADVQLHLKGLQDAARAQAAFDPATLDLSLVAGFRDVLESIVLPQLIAAFAQEAPGLRLAAAYRCTTLPLRLKPFPILAYWHESREADRAHQWFRERVIALVQSGADFADTLTAHERTPPD